MNGSSPDENEEFEIVEGAGINLKGNLHNNSVYFAEGHQNHPSIDDHLSMNVP